MTGPDAQLPLVSIVTAVRDAAGTIERTIRSVLAQTWPRLEHIVIDGASRDGTQEVIRRCADRLAYWSSEPDRGIAAAFNKGIAASRGAYLGFVNADDWLSPDQIANAIAALERTGADFVFGDLVYHDGAGRPLHRIQGDPAYARSLAHGMPDINHPTLLARREVYTKIGGFNEDYRFAMDYDWLVRAHHAGFRGVYEPEVVGHMSLSGASDRNWHLALDEVRRISIRHGYPPGPALARYAGRLAKGGGRRVLRRTVPARLHDHLRQRFRRRFVQKT